MTIQATYNYKLVRQFAVMTVIWGIVGMLVGVIIAAQLVWPELNLHEFLGYGRLRPLHTNAVIFAFGGCALFATSYYVVQRTCHAPLFAQIGLVMALCFTAFQAIPVGFDFLFPLHTNGGSDGDRKWWLGTLLSLLGWGSLGLLLAVILSV